MGLPERRAFGDALFGPRQMIGFLVGCAAQGVTQRRIARGKRLPLIQRLGTNFAHMIDAHQPTGMGPFLLAHPRLGKPRSGGRALTPRRRENGAQCAVEFKNKLFN